MVFRFRRIFPIKFLCCITIVYVFLTVITNHTYYLLMVRDLGYLTRPIWDNPGRQPEKIIAHFQSETVPYADLCNLHGWKERNDVRNVSKVIDAVIFSIELDILEIRIRELWDVVDIFLVMEADRTFTGKQKPLVLAENIDRFKFAEEKLRHVVAKNLKENPQHNFDNEDIMRMDMTDAIQDLQLKNGDLVIVGDVDEIPFKETIKLLKNCEGYNRELHLQMRNYIYSFEFYTDTTHWRPHVDTFSAHFTYHHGEPTDSNDPFHLLADAGWHCSYCFRYLSDFVFKMTSFSHSDRMTGQHLLEKANIQRKICDGSNIFDMYEEVYTFKDLIGSLGQLPRKFGTMGIPAAIMNRHEYFKFLLPGGCIREDAPDEYRVEFID